MIGDRWGVTDAEVALRFGCDALLEAPVLSAWRGVTVAAPPERVWPWVGQIRVAPYSYDWVDNLGRRSPRTLLGLDPPQVGEPFTRTAGRPVGEVLAVDPGRELTGRILGALMSYRLEPHGDSTRLLLKVVMGRGRVLAPLVSVGDLVMARRQLLTFKELAERG
ncbi:polyketide cyclase [Phycicoccus sp. HDW14]|uniref:polyketide cyclase n=1 Tax=Phycicoccus sp. HDW14 TaxID=2714941 RepID=UPI001409594A|nr:polyketide cyclase [Phycicoccus sp. HDW14]QIM22117.1 polyketide cyclase [Phycicoccus sp. HDW14]